MRLFGVQEAERLIPALAHTFTTIRGWIQRVHEITEQLNARRELVRSGGVVEGKGSGVLQLRGERDRLVASVQDEIEKLEEMGIEVKSLHGLVDFRALRGGRQVYLCWQYPEPSITHWHELDGGFASRRPIEKPSAFEPSYLS